MKRSLSSSAVTTALGIQNDGSKKIKMDLSCESSERSAVNYEEIWSQLKVIASDLASSNEKEINDIMFVLSQDADKFTYFDTEYGDKVHTAIKATIKLLYSNGEVGSELWNFLWVKRNEIIITSGLTYLNAEAAEINEWKTVTTVANNLFVDFAFGFVSSINAAGLNTNAKKKNEFAIILSTDPNIIHNQRNVMEIGAAKIEMAVAICTHILDGVLRISYDEFRQLRNTRIRHYWRYYMKDSTSHSTFEQVHSIVKKYCYFETDELQIEAVAILLMMDIKMLQSKYLLFRKTLSNELRDEILNELETLKIDQKQSSLPLPNYLSDVPIKDEIMEISMPLIAHVERKVFIKKFARKIKNHVHLMQLGRADLIFFGQYRKGKFICGNLETFNWLQNAINDFSPDVSINDYTLLASNDLIQTIMISSSRLKQPFDVYMELIKDSYPNLRTNLWARVTSTSDSEYKWNIIADVESIVHLEKYKRRLDVGNLIIKFDIRYIE